MRPTLRLQDPGRGAPGRVREQGERAPLQTHVELQPPRPPARPPLLTDLVPSSLSLSVMYAPPSVPRARLSGGKHLRAEVQP